MKYKHVGEFLRFKRQDKGLTLDALSKMTNISINYLSKLEKGLNNNPSDNIISSLAQSLEIDEDSLFIAFDKTPVSVRNAFKRHPELSKAISQIYNNEDLSDKEKDKLFERMIHWYEHLSNEEQ